MREISSIRGDSTLWLDDPRCGTASKNFLAALDVLRKQLNQSLMLGLESVEAHFAIYPAGMGYGRHRDRFRWVIGVSRGIHPREEPGVWQIGRAHV